MKWQIMMLTLTMMISMLQATTISVVPHYAYNTTSSTVTIYFTLINANASQTFLMGSGQNLSVQLENISLTNVNLTHTDVSTMVDSSFYVLAPTTDKQWKLNESVIPSWNQSITISNGTTGQWVDIDQIPKIDKTFNVTANQTIDNTTYGITIKGDYSKANVNKTLQTGQIYTYAPSNITIRAAQMNESAVISYYNSNIGGNCETITNITNSSGYITARYCSMLNGNVIPGWLAICGAPTWRNATGWTGCEDAILASANQSANQYRILSANLQNRLTNATSELSIAQTNEQQQSQYAQDPLYLGVAFIIVSVGIQVLGNMERAKKREGYKYGK